MYRNRDLDSRWDENYLLWGAKHINKLSASCMTLKQHNVSVVTGQYQIE